MEKIEKMAESDDDILLEDIVVDENYDSMEIYYLFMTAFSTAEKDKIGNLLFENFKQFFLQKEPSVKSLLKKARFVSSFGYNSRITVYFSVKDFIISHLKNKIKQNIIDTPSLTFLRSFASAWETYFEALNKVNDVMDYMENIHSGHNKLEHFDVLGVILFRNLIFDDEMVQTRLRKELFEMNQFSLFMSNRFIIEDISKMCIVLKKDDFNKNIVIPLILKQSTKYFKSLSKDFLLKHCAIDYFQNAEAIINKETERIDTKFEIQTKIEFVNIIKRELVIKNMKKIVEIKNCGVEYMLKNNRDDDLKWMYNFLCSVKDGVKVMFNAMRPYFREVGTSVVLENKGNSDVDTCIQSLLDLKEKFDKLRVNLFDDDTVFDDILGEEFDYFLKCNPLISKYLSIFIDRKLKKGKNTLIQHKEEADIDKVVFMIKHMKDKKIFEYTHQLHLRNRLINFRPVNMKYEKNIVSKLKDAYINSNGSSIFISKIEGMVKDRYLSSKTMKNYKERVCVDKCIFGIIQPFNLNVTVITSVNWSVNPKQFPYIPSFGSSAFSHFNKFFKQNNPNKGVMLLPQFGSVELKATFYGKPNSIKRPWTNNCSKNVIKRVERYNRIVVTTYEMCVLDLFNTHNTLTYEEIKKETKIPKNILDIVLDDLVFGNRLHNLLLKTPMDKEIKFNDRFYVNESFEFK